MRIAFAGFGLLALLITVAIILMAYVPHAQTVLKEGQHAKEEASIISGRDMSGRDARDSYNVEPQASGGKTVSLLVTKVVPGGAMEQRFGLKKDDTITEINGMRVRDYNDDELATAQMLDAYQRSWPITVVRDGQTLTLKPDEIAAGASGTPTVTPVPNNGAPNPGTGTDGGVQGQLNAIQNLAR
jgi:hypothetical protein